MSEAELHILRQRMWQGALQKARRGELPSKGPIGYVRVVDQLAFDPDEQAQDVVRLIFDQFDRLGTMNAVLRHLVAQEIQIPVRPARGPAKGQLEWRRPSQSSLQNMLNHPVYAGAYVFGRSCQSKQARQQKRPSRLPRDQWLVLLRDRHPAYISWQQYEENQIRLEQNRSHYSSRCSVRQGRALLAGLVVCGRCGYRFRTHYSGRGTRPRYTCSANQSRFGEEQCQSLAAEALDDEVARLTLKALEPSALDVSLEVAQDIQQQREAAEKLWRQRLERAAYEAERTSRQYHVVEPENRLVARTLEAAWEEKLRVQRDLQEQYERFLMEQPMGLSDEEQERIRRLATDVPALWQATSTTDADRKEILREVIERVVVNVEGESEWVEAKIHWAGGHQTFTRFRRPVQRMEQLSTWLELKRRIQELLEAGMSAPKIAAQLNSEGLRTAEGKSFNEGSVRMVMVRQGLKSAQQKSRRNSIKLHKHEWLVGQLATKLQVTYGTIHQWIHDQRVEARQLDDRRWVVTADDAKCQELLAYRVRQGERRKHHASSSAQAEL